MSIEELLKMVTINSKVEKKEAEEGLKQMKEYGWSEQGIIDHIQLHNEAKADGLDVSFCMGIDCLPKNFP